MEEAVAVAVAAEKTPKKTSISVTEEFRDWLVTQGKKDETYEHILRRLLVGQFPELEKIDKAA